MHEKELIMGTPLTNFLDDIIVPLSKLKGVIALLDRESPNERLELDADAKHGVYDSLNDPLQEIWEKRERAYGSETKGLEKIN